MTELEHKFKKLIHKIKDKVNEKYEFIFIRQEINDNSISLFFNTNNNATPVGKIEKSLDKCCKTDFEHETTMLSDTNQIKIKINPPNYYNIKIKKKWIYYVILLSLFWILIPYL